MTIPNAAALAKLRKFLQRVGLVGLLLGVLVFLAGIFPRLIGIATTPGMGIAQLVILLSGVALFTLGGYIYARNTRVPHPQPRLRESIGLRLMATGYVICVASGLADVLGIGTHSQPANFPVFGAWQAVGFGIGLVVIIVGILLYAQKYSPNPEANNKRQIDPNAQ